MARRYAYTFPVTVAEYDCDVLLRLSATAALAFLQHAATAHLETLHLPYERLYEEGKVFFLSAQAVKFHRMPRCGDRLLAATVPIAARGAHFLRETVLLSPDGELLVEGQSAWALLDPKTARPLRASQFEYDIGAVGEEDWEPFCDPSRIRIRPPELPLGERTVRLSDLDRNRHMNNTVYAGVLLDCFPEECLKGTLDTLFLRYRRQARLGETMALSGGFDGQQYTAGGQIGGQPCFEGAFSLKPLDGSDAG